MASFIALIVVLLAGCYTSKALTVHHRANPVRKVVTLLQNMQTKVEDEGKKGEELFDKYMCYCKTAGGSLGDSIAAAEIKIPQLESTIKEDTATKTQLDADLVEHKKDREESKEILAKTAAMREKEAKSYAAEKADFESNIAALSKAIPAIEKGMGASFLQTEEAAILRKLSISMEMNAGDRGTLASFLSQGNGASYVPQSGEILGILKELKDEMTKDLNDATDTENGAIKDYEDLVAAKTKQIESLTKAIEIKTSRVGELAVKIAEFSNDLEDTEETLEQDKKFLADLDKNCVLKKKAWEAYSEEMQLELKALADTIKLLNDDDARELFTKTLPSSASSFIQIQDTSAAMQQRAMASLKGHSADPRVDLLEIALRGGKIGFTKIIGMIDDLVGVLEKEQGDDDKKKTWCLAEFDSSDDEKKMLELDISDIQKAIDDGEESITTLKNEMAALKEGLATLDGDVKTQTEQRKVEHSEYVELLAFNNAAKDLLGMAKNRLNKFYNPKLYKAPPKRVMSEEDQITVNMGGTLAPTSAPGGIAGTGIMLAETGLHTVSEGFLAYQKSTEENAGVLAMLDLLINDIDKQNTEMEMTEKESQADYEKFMKDAASKRAEDSKLLTDKMESEAAVSDEVEQNKEALKSKSTNLAQTNEYIGGLHKDCDWLLKNYDLRKEARDEEIDSLKKGKDVLNGADYS